MSGIRINEIPSDSALDGNFDLVHVYKLVGGQFKSVAAPLSAVAFQGPTGTSGQDGTNGIDGSDGGSFAQLVCYRRFDPNTSTADISATRPGLGTNDDGSFNFTTREFIEPTGWYRTPPAVTPSTSDHILYQTTGVAFVPGREGLDTNIAWSDPENGGIDGRPGTDGKSTFQAQVYTRAATNPGAPTGGSFNFGNDELTAPSGWYIDVAGDLGPPESDDPVWVCTYQFGIPGDTGTDTATTWGPPTKFTGTDGADGYSTYFGIIYKRTNTDISADRPGNGDGTAVNNAYYDFRANQFVFSPALTGAGGFMEGWSEIPPPDEKVAGQTTALWSSTTVATARSNFLGSDPVLDESLTWTLPQKVVQSVVDGNRGDAVTQVRAYIRSFGGTPSLATLENAGVAFNFQDKIVDLGTSGWSNEPYASTLEEGETGYGSDVLYVSVGVARSTFNGSVYPNDTDIEWATPIQSSEEGQDAISTFLAQCYTRYTGSTVLSDYPPTGGSYSFTNNLLTPPTDGSGEGLTWYVNIPPGTGQIYVTQQQFAIRGNEGSRDGGSNWSSPAVLAYDGAAGFSGATNAGISLYYGSDTELTGDNIPDFPDNVTVSVDLDPGSSGFGNLTKSTTNGQDASITSNQVLSSNSVGTTEGTGWYTRIPDNDWIYITQAVAADSNTTDSNYIDTIAGTEWSETVAFRKPGGNGLTGLGASIVSLYKRTGSSQIPNPAEPSGPIKYYLGSGDGQLRGDILSIDGTNFNGWTKDPPSYTNSNDHYLWQINATASSRLCADKIFANEWSTPRIFSQNPFDLTETTVSHTVQAYIRSSVLPTTDPGTCTVFLSGENAGQITAALSNGWSREIPDGDQQVYIAHATAAGTVTTITDTDTVDASEWSSPAKWGIVGEQGERGLVGNVAKIVTLYKRTIRNPNPAVVVPALDGNYDFNADTLSAAFTFEAPDNETWTLEIPAKQVNDKKLWQTFATALCSQDSSVYSISATEWSTPKAVLEDGVTITPVFSSNFDGVSASLDSVFLSSGEFKDHTHINFSDEYESIDPSEILTKTNGDTVAANTLTYIKIKGEQGIQGLQGLQGNQGDGVLVAYAEDANGTNVSESPATSKPFVKYHEYSGSKPDVSTLEGTSGFVKYTGEDANQIVPVYATDASGSNPASEPTVNSTHVSFVEDTAGDLIEPGTGDLNTTRFTAYQSDPGVTFVKIKGEDGSSINILGTKDTQSQLTALVSTAAAGDAYMGSGTSAAADALTDGNLYVFNGVSFTDVGKIKGDKGDIGSRGFKEQIHFKYANDTTGNGEPDTFTTQSGEDQGEYLGFAVTDSQINPNNIDPSSIGNYTFTKVKADPKFTHIAYADNISGTTNFSLSPGSRAYIGIAVDRSELDPTTNSNNYTWSKIKGEDGEQGIRGPVGSVPIFASAPDGTNPSLTQSDSRPYVFFYTGGDVASDAPQETLQGLGTATSWKKITGDSLYTHIKYADRVLTSDDSASDMTDDPTGKKYIGLSLNNTSSDEDTSGPGDFSWSLIQAEALKPDGFQVVPAYTNSNNNTITFDSEKGELILSEESNSADIGIGMAWPAVNVDGYRAAGKTISGQIKIKASSSIGDNSHNNSGRTVTRVQPSLAVYFRAYEYNAELPAGKTTMSLSTPHHPSVLFGDGVTQVHRTKKSRIADGNEATTGYFLSSFQGWSTNNVNFLEHYDPHPNGAGYTIGNGTGSGVLTATEFVTVPFEYVPSPDAKYVAFNILNWDSNNFLGKIDTADEDGDGNTNDDIAFNRGYVDLSVDMNNPTNTVTISDLFSTDTVASQKANNTSATYTTRIGLNGDDYINFHAGDYVKQQRDGVDFNGNPKTFIDYWGYDGPDNASSTSVANFSLRETTDKNLHTGPLTLTIAGSKGDKGTNSITTRLAEIFYKQNITLRPPAVTRQLLLANIDSIVAANPIVNDNTSANWKTIATDATSFAGTNGIRLFHRTFPSDGTHNSSWAYDDTTGILKMTATRSGGTGDFGSYFRVLNLKPDTKYRVSGEYRMVEDTVVNGNGTRVMIDMSDGDADDTNENGTDLFRVESTSTSFESFSVTGTMNATNLAEEGLDPTKGYYHFVDINVITNGSGDKNGTITGEFRNFLIEEITDESAVSNTTYDISTGDLSNVPSGWATIPPNAESGKKIYRATAIVSYDADLETDTDATVLIPDTDWGDSRSWSDGGNRTAPQVSRIATYEYLDSNYESVDNSLEPISSFYSFRKEGILSVDDDNDGDGVEETSGDVNNGYSTAITTSTEGIDSIGQILFNKFGKDGLDNTDFWRNLSTTSEFIWKYGSSWISFQRTGPIDLGGKWTGVRVNVLDHSDDLQFIKDLPGHYKPYDTGTGTPDTSKAAEVIFGYTPTIIKQTVYLHRRTDSASAPIDVSADLEYNFSTGSITGNTANWSLEPPASTGSNKYLWRIQATATAKLDLTTLQYTDTILASEWSTPAIFAQDGSEGDAGGSFFQKFLYTRTTVSNPAFKSGWSNTTYKPDQMQITISDVGGDFIGRIRGTDIDATGDNALVSPGGITWYEDIPDESLGQFLWVIVAPIAGSASNGNYVTVANTSWAEPVLLSKDGVGLNSATIRLYRRTSGGIPSGGGQSGVNALGFSASSGTPTFTYTFDTGVLDFNGVTTNDWSQSTDATTGGTLWVSRAVASSAGTQDEIEWSQWSDPEKLVTDGTALILIDETFDGTTSEDARNAYIDFIDTEYGDGSPNSGIPPANSYHIEVVNGKNISYLYTGGQNGTDKNNATKFRQLTIDGADGQQGTSFEFKGTVSNIGSVTTPAIGDVYRVTGSNFSGNDPRTSSLPALIVWKGTAWALLTSDGSDGAEGTAGASSRVFICYNTNTITNEPTPPPNTSTGNYTGTPDTWSTTPSDAANWMSFKIAENNDDNIPWEDPLLITGAQGDPGTSTFNIKIFKRFDGFPGQPTGGAYDFEKKRILVPTTGNNPYGGTNQNTWSTTSVNATKGPSGVAPTTNPEDAIGYEWTLTPGTVNSVENSSTWDITAIDNSANAALPLWSSKATVSVGATSPDQIDSSITWTTPILETLNGFDFDDDSIDPDAIFGVVQGSGVLKIVARDRKENPLTDAAYAALGNPSDTTRLTNYGWVPEDTIDEQTLYIIR